jgi:thioredoxin reductase
MKAFDIALNVPEEVKDIKKKINIISSTTDKDNYNAKSVIVAAGKRPKELGLKEESRFKNKGLTYCATCDGPLFRDKDVASYRRRKLCAGCSFTAC